MSRRNSLDRCATCRMQVTLCICDQVPQLQARTRLVLLIHQREARKPTNTGLLAACCLARSTIEVIGDEDHRATLPPLEADEQPLLLYPADDAVSIEAYAATPRPVLIVPDGSWRQAHKMRRRVPGLVNVPCVTLPDVGPTRYQLRAEHHEGGLATLEAIARALRILEGAPATAASGASSASEAGAGDAAIDSHPGGAAIESALLGVFRIMVDRTLWLRGRLGDDEVTGGLPEAARVQNPRSTRAARAE